MVELRLFGFDCQVFFWKTDGRPKELIELRKYRVNMFTVIMAGGSGTRFWPASRRHRPKQFLDITGNGPLMLETAERVRGLARDDEILVIVGRPHADETAKLFEGRGVHILAEPVGRNTGACVALGASYARYLGDEGPLAFLPADHSIKDTAAFVEALETAAKKVASGGIVVLGIVPDRPETGYGYIRRGDEAIDMGGMTGYRAVEFKEKPGRDKAREFLSTGRYYWNAGVFIATSGTILEEIRTLMPELYGGLERLEKTFGTPGFETEFEMFYHGIESISFDHAVMERTDQRIYVLPCDCGWNDVGSWRALYELRAEARDPEGNLALGEVFLVDCAGNFIDARKGRAVTCLGLQNCLVVDTGDALLVADLDRSQDVRKLVELMKEKGKEELL